MIDVWKVVRRVRVGPDADYQLMSCVQRGPLGITYSVGNWVEPQVGSILAFDIIPHAYEFAQNQTSAILKDSNLELWHADAEIAEPQRVYDLLGFPVASDENWVKAFWGKGGLPFSEYRWLQKAPLGTVCCSKLKLVAPMKWSDAWDWIFTNTWRVYERPKLVI